MRLVSSHGHCLSAARGLVLKARRLLSAPWRCESTAPKRELAYRKTLAFQIDTRKKAAPPHHAMKRAWLVALVAAAEPSNRIHTCLDLDKERQAAGEES